MEFFWSPNCSCDYRQINTWCCPQPALPAGTGNDAIHAALTLTGPRETTASLTRKMLSISLAGRLCPVIVMLPRRWHLCYADGKCLSNHLLIAQFEFSSTLMDSSWRIIIKKIKSSPTANATAAATPWRCPTELVTKAVDGRTASPCRPLPFGCCAAAQRLNLATFLIVLEGPGERPCPFSDLNDTSDPLPRKWCLYPCQGTAALYRTMCWGLFFMAEPASLKPRHLYWPTSRLSPLSLSHPPLFPCLKQYSLPVVIDSRRLGPSKCSFESGVILTNCSNSRWQGWEGLAGSNRPGITRVLIDWAAEGGRSWLLWELKAKQLINKH